MSYTLGFMGCGNMGGALVRAAATSVAPERIAVYDPDCTKTDALADALSVVSVSLETLVKESKFLILGIKPQVMERALADIAPLLAAREDLILVTMAAGLSISAIRTFAHSDKPVIRIMPNTPASRGAGMILYAAADVSEADETAFLDAFAGAGLFDKLPEDKIDAAGCLSGCGPAFVYAFAEALADGAVECGIPRDKAILYAAQTLLGAAEMLKHDPHPANLKDAVCSPGGTTIAGIHALERNRFRGTVMDAVEAAYTRTLELKK